MDGDGDAREKIAEHRSVSLKPQLLQGEPGGAAEQYHQHHRDDGHHGAVTEIQQQIRSFHRIDIVFGENWVGKGKRAVSLHVGR